MEVQAHYHSCTGTNDSHNVVKFSINRLIVNADGRNINKAHILNLLFVHYVSGILLLSLAGCYKPKYNEVLYCFPVS